MHLATQGTVRIIEPARMWFTNENCSVARTLEVIGERWTLLILREAFLGVHRFEAFQRNTGSARNILAARLKKLVDRGVLERRRERRIRLDSSIA